MLRRKDEVVALSRRASSTHRATATGDTAAPPSRIMRSSDASMAERGDLSACAVIATDSEDLEPCERRLSAAPRASHAPTAKEVTAQGHNGAPSEGFAAGESAWSDAGASAVFGARRARRGAT